MHARFILMVRYVDSGVIATCAEWGQTAALAENHDHNDPAESRSASASSRTERSED
jgi:hypothetical protein